MSAEPISAAAVELSHPLPAPELAAAAGPPAPLGERTRHGLGVLGAAAALGVAGDLLLRAAPWGINLTLFTLALAATAVGLQRWARVDEAVRGWVPLVVAIGVLAAWRDSAVLKTLDLLALLVVLGLAVASARGASVRRASLTALAAGLLRSLGDAIIGTGVVAARDVRWAELKREGWSRHAFAVGRGVAIAAPLLLVFGALLAAADAAFEGLLGRVFAFDGPVVFSHVFLAGFLAWGAGGVLRPLVLRSAPAEDVLPRLKPPLGVVEVGVVLGLLNLLFLSFVAVQVSYLFGGAERVVVGDLTYAEYARRGFFELVTVAGMVLPLLLLLDWAMRRDGPAHERVFRVLAGGQVALLFVIMASALYRMRMYQAAYGLTELRLYTTAFMLWLAAVFAWLAATVLRGRRDRFAFGALVAAMEAVVLLHVVNPDALIVRVNAGRDPLDGVFDAPYATTLSADAVPTLLAAMPTMQPEVRCFVAGDLLGRMGRSRRVDWRTWSLARSRAFREVRAARDRLREYAACPPGTRPLMRDVYYD